MDGGKDPFLLGLDTKPAIKTGQKKEKIEKATVPTEADPFMLGADVKKKDSPSDAEVTATDLENGVENTSQELPSPLGYKRQIERKPVMAANKKPDLLKEPESDVFGKSFLDRDIEKRFLLSNPSYNKPTDPLSLSNLYNHEAQRRYDSKVAYSKQDIKSSPEKLAAYTQTRIDELNTDIKNAKDNVKGIYEAQAYGAKLDPDIANNYERQLADATNEKNKLKAAVAVEAANKFVPQYLSPNRPFDPKGLAHDIIKIADPEQAFIFDEAQKNGSSLPGITQSNLEKTGIDLSLQYLESQPQTEFVKQKLQEVKDYDKDFDERNFELTAQRAKEKIGVYFYEKGKSGFWGYSGKNIEKAINDPETGLTDAEKKVAFDYVLPTESKLVFSTDIPGSGFFRAGKNAIEKSLINTGNTFAGWVGTRDDTDRAYDLLSDETENSRFRAPGDSPTFRTELNYLNDKESKGKLTEEEKTRKVELDKYVDVRNGWSKFRDGVGDLTGQVVEIALLTKGVGTAGAALSAFGEGGGILGGLTTSSVGAALSNETAGLFLSSYLNSYDSYKTQSLQLMPGEKNAANRDAYAKVMAGVEGLSEKIFDDTKVLKAFTKEVAPTVADITSRFINKEITQQVARDELRKGLSKYLNPFRKEFVKSTFQESFEEGIVDVADGMAQSIFGGQPFDIGKTGQQAINTFLTTALYSPLVSGAAAHGHARQNMSRNAFVKSAIVDMANSPVNYLKSVEDLRLSGQITQPEANEKIKLINSAAQYLKEIPSSITIQKKSTKQVDTKVFDDKWKQNLNAINDRTDISEEEKTKLKFQEDARHAEEMANFQKEKNASSTTEERQLDFPEISSYLVHRLNEGIINEQLQNLEDEALRPVLEQKLKRSIEIRKGIINNSIGVTPDIQEVTDNPKKAEDLGIADANNLSPDELIGTPFQKEEPVAEESKGITKEAEDLLSSIKEGSKPTFIAKNLEKIAKENGIEVTDKMTADDVINSLKDKQKTATESPASHVPAIEVGAEDSGKIYETLDNYEVNDVEIPDGIENETKWQEKLVDKAFSDMGVKPHKEVAGTGTIYYTFDGKGGEKIKVRLGDHSKGRWAGREVDANVVYDKNSSPRDVLDILRDKLPDGEIIKIKSDETSTNKESTNPKIRVTAKEMKAAQPKAAKQKSDRQEKINSLRDRVDSFNKMRANDKNKSAALNELRLDATDMGLVIDYGKGHAILKYEGGGKVQRRSSETNSNRAKNFDGKKYNPVTQEAVGKIVEDPLLITGLALKGDDGYRMSEAQKEAAIESIKEGKPNNGAKAIYDFFENAENGNILIEDLATGQEIPMSIDEYFSALQNLQPATDEDIESLHTSLGEEAFSDLFDETLYNETTNENEQPTNETGQVEQTAETETGANPEETGGSERVTQPSQPEEKTITQKGKELADRIRGLKSKRDALQANIFGIPIAIYDGVIETIATAVENGAILADAIQQGIKSLSKKDGELLDEDKFIQHIEDIVAGKKPKVTTTGEIVDDEKIDKDDVKSVAKAIKEDKIKFKDAIEGKSEKFVDALNKELYGSKRFNMDEEGFRESVRKQKEFGLTKADIIAGLSSIKKLTQKQVNIIDDVFLESALTDKALEELNESFINLAKGIKPKKVLARLANSDANALVSALNGALTYTSVSNKQQEDIADYILAITDVNDIEDYIDKMSANNLADVKQILRAKAIIELQKNGNSGLAKQLVEDMADDAVTAGRQTQTLRKVYQILNAKGNAQIKTEFARKFAQKVQETALAMNKRMVDVLNGKESEIKALNEKLHDQAQKSPGFLSKLQDLLDKICNVRRKK